MSPIAPAALLLTVGLLHAQTTPIEPSTPLPPLFQRFGEAITIEGNRAAVGSPGENRVYIFEFEDGVWTESQSISLNLLGGSSSDMSLDLDGNWLAVGLPQEAVGTTVTGRIHLYENNGASYVFRQTWLPTSFVVGGLFGWSVAIDDDILAVGAPGQERAEVFRLNFGTQLWDREAVVTASGASFGIDADFGHHVAFDKQIGVLVVAAPRGSNALPANDRGILFSYRESTNWADASTLPSSGDNWRQGEGLAMTKRAGSTFLLVGSPGANSTGEVRVVRVNSTGTFSLFLTRSPPAGLSTSEWGREISASENYACIASTDGSFGWIDITRWGQSSPDWQSLQRERSPSDHGAGIPTAEWGAALAVTDEHVLVGDPVAFNSRGAVVQVKQFHLEGFTKRTGGSTYVSVAYDELQTDPTEGGTLISSIANMRGWKAESINVLRVVGDRHQNVCTFAGIDAQNGDQTYRYALPPFPPGPEDVASLPADLVVEIPGSNPVETIEDALVLQVTEVVAVPGTGSAIQGLLDTVAEGTRIRMPAFSSYVGLNLNLGRSRITLMGDLNDPSSVELFGAGGSGLTITGASSGNTVCVGGFQIRNASTGIHVTNSARPWIRAVRLQGNNTGLRVTSSAAPLVWDLQANANSQGAVVVDGAGLTLRDSLIIENDATQAGAGIRVVNTPTSELVTVFSSVIGCNRTTAGRGGGIYLGIDARARIFGTDIYGNWAPLGGGGVALEDPGDVEVANCMIIGNRNPNFGCLATPTNTLHSDGGGIYARTQNLLRIEANDIRENRASTGASIFIANGSNPRIARNWIVCNACEQAAQDGPGDFFAPGIYLEGSSFATASQADVLNNTIMGNVVLGTPGPSGTERGFGVQGGLMGQGAPQIVNNIITSTAACSAGATAPQGWAVKLAANQFTSIRSNVLFDGLESTQGATCAGPGNTAGNIVCDTCCPIAGITSANLYTNPVLGSNTVTEVGPGSNAYLSGLPADPSLPPDLYSGFMLVSRGYIERDGVLVGGSFVNTIDRASDPGSNAAIELDDPTIPAQYQVTIDVDLQVVPQTAFSIGVQVVTYGADFSFKSAFNTPIAGPPNSAVELPIRVPYNGVREVALFQLDTGLGKYLDTGIRTTNVNVQKGVIRFEGVDDFSTRLIGVVIAGEGGAWSQYGLNASPTNTIELDGAGSTKLGKQFFAVSSQVTGAPGLQVISLGQANVPALGGQLLVDPLTWQVFLMPVVGGTFTFPFTVPSSPTTIGTTLYFQSAAFQPANPAQFEFSNGLMMTICP